MKNLRNELETSQLENRTLRDREDQWDMKKIHLESKIRDHDGESEKINLLTSTFETERQVNPYDVNNVNFYIMWKG